LASNRELEGPSPQQGHFVTDRAAVRRLLGDAEDTL
jgi:hypothetical protein